MYTIATLYQLQQQLGLDSGDDDDRLLAALQSASAQIERLAGRRFCPRQAAIAHSVYPRHADELLLVDDLLALDTLTSNDGGVYAAEDLLLLPGGDWPAALILLTGGNTFTWAETPVSAVTVTGTWGWHDGWSRAWRDSGEVVKDAPLAASATPLTVADATGADAENQAPRFQVGHLLQIESEYLRLLAITINEGSDDTLTVARGVNGTTAAAHAQNTPIFTYQPPPDVTRLVVRWAAWLYREPDSHIPEDVPPALLRELGLLRRVGVKA